MDMIWETQESVKDREACSAAVYGVTKSQIQLSYWTTATITQNPVADGDTSLV